MANITEVSQWENVIRQLENGEAATGGADGLANIQAKQLANRTQWLKDNYLPSTGGVLAAGNLFYNKKTNNGRLVLFGGETSSASMELFGGESDVFAGGVVFRAESGDVKSALRMKPDGKLLHEPVRDGSANDLAGAAIVAKSLGANGYVKYASGLIIQWVKSDLSENIDGLGNCLKVNFPLSFSNINYNLVVTKSYSIEYISLCKGVSCVEVNEKRTVNSAILALYGNDGNLVSPTAGYSCCIAIGY